MSLLLRSGGFSTTNSAPDWCAASRMAAQRETMVLACLTFARWRGARLGRPSGCCRFRSGRGPGLPSLGVKNRETEKGAAWGCGDDSEELSVVGTVE